MESYSPFSNTNISDLTALDLEILKSVNEGWYVEYKSELNNSQSIAKSISSFANSYGGWLFYGIKEKDKADNTAGSFPGIPKSEVDAALQTIRHSVARHLNPIPHFDTKIVEGPESGIELAKDHVVICIYVPFSIVAPHIHARGCIYRRVADSSEPKPETDRHQLDLLWGRKEKIDNEYTDWINRVPERSKGESEQPYLRLLLDADLYRLEGKTWDLTADDILSVMNDEEGGVGIPVDACYPSDRGMVARQTSSLSRHADFGLTWIIGRGLRCEVWIPLNVHETEGASYYVSGLEKYQNTNQFLDLLNKAKVSNGKVLDLNQLWQILHAVVNKYLCLLDKNNTPRNAFFGKIILSEIWRSVPFFDSKTILERMEKYGLPICLSTESIVPGGTGADSFHKLKYGDSSESNLRAALPAAIIMELVCRALGLQMFFADTEEEMSAELLIELMNTGGH